jgi:ATP-dependent helicase/nuclease subunit A
MGSLKVKGKQRSVSGKIDRLAVTPDRVLIVDYKTNRPPPATLAQVPDAYVLQLGLYRELLKPLYPGRGIVAALLFTEAPRLIELTAEVMDAALARLTLS